jgi:nucleotidyltransferase/DNA polymerase involved in DNA repair
LRGKGHFEFGQISERGAAAASYEAPFKIKWADFQQSTRGRSLPKPFTTQTQLNQITLDLIRSVFQSQKGIRLVGMTLSNFGASAAPPAAEQPNLNLPLLPKS